MINHLAPLAFVVLAVTSCVSPKTVYKEFYGSRSHRAVMVSSDGAVFEDKIGKWGDAFVIPESADLMNKLQWKCMQALEARGYKPVTKGYQSTGCNRPPLKLGAYEAENRKDYEGPQLTGPYSVARSGGSVSASQKAAIEGLYVKIAGMNMLSKSTPQTQLPEIGQLGLPKNQYACFVCGLSRNVPIGKQIGQGVLVGVLTLGTIAVWEADVAYVKIAIIDPDTQRIVWGNQGAGNTKIDEQANSVDLILKDLPNALPPGP